MRAMGTAALAALFGLAACGDGSGSANDSAANQAAPANAAAPANSTAGGKDPENGSEAARPAAALAEGGPRAVASSPSSEIRALLIGRWTDNGNCTDATEFRPDGSFTSPLGAGRWVLENEYLTLSIAGAPDGEVAVQQIDRLGMETISPSGRIGRWSRC